MRTMTARMVTIAACLLGVTLQADAIAWARPLAVAQAPPPASAGAAGAATVDGGRTRVILTGRWKFAMDPGKEGEAFRWFAPEYGDGGWDAVDVPHCWPLDPRYTFVGTAWYRRTFEVPAGAEGRHARIEFDAVFARARVWLNGELLGSHEGGYTPFGFDVTPQLIAGKPNVIVVAADNSWSTKTLPGARPGKSAQERVYPWWDYGGIVRPVSLVLSSPVYVEKQRIIATPDLASGSATIDATVWVRNTGSVVATANVSVALARIDGERAIDVVVDGAVPRAAITVQPGAIESVALRATLPRDAVRLWNLDRPVLYSARASVSNGANVANGANAANAVNAANAANADASSDALVSTFGIRRFEVRGTQLLLNGRPIRLGGANRPNDHPRFGLIEPREVVEQDLRLMKAAGMELQRMIHYALPNTLLDAADRMGILLIAEAGNWQLQPGQMDDEEIRADYRHQMREMVERDWNHPSVVAWSVGNEYASDTPAGVRWTRDMYAFVKTIDASRPITFASYRADKAEVQRPEDEGSHYVDFVGVNIYGSPKDYAARLDRVHARWPDKPVFITEFGLRADKVADERERVQYFRDAVQALRDRPFVVGGSVWTFNDYRSRFPDTAANGYRPWGLVDPDRKPRAAYDTVAKEFAAARIVAAPAERTNDGRLLARVSVEARGDFPSRTLVGLSVRARAVDEVSLGSNADAARSAASSRMLEAAGITAPPNTVGSPSAPAEAAAAVAAVPDLEPGARAEVTIAAPPQAAGAIRIELLRADGSVMDHVDIVDMMMSARRVDGEPGAHAQGLAAWPDRRRAAERPMASPPQAAGAIRIELLRTDGSVMDHVDIIDTVTSTRRADAAASTRGSAQ